MGEECLGGDFVVEGDNVFEVLVVGFLEGIPDELGHCFLSGEVDGMVLDEDAMRRLHTILDDSSCIFGDVCVVCYWASGVGPCLSPRGRVGGVFVNEVFDVV